MATARPILVVVGDEALSGELTEHIVVAGYRPVTVGARNHRRSCSQTERFPARIS